MDNATAAILGALIGGAVGLVGSAITNYYADKRNIREICLKSAIEQWKKDIDTAIELKQNGAIFPPDDYALYFMLFTKLILEKGIVSPKKLEKCIRRIDKIITHTRGVRVELDRLARARARKP
jgi:hypothetical protein